MDAKEMNLEQIEARLEEIKQELMGDCDVKALTKEVDALEERKAELQAETSKKESEPKNKKPIYIIVAVVVIAAIIGIVAFAMSGNDSKDNSKSEQAEQTTEESASDTTSEDESEPSFKEANVFSFKQKKWDDESYDDIINTCEIINNGDKTINYFDVSVAFYDSEGTELSSDSRFYECSLKKGKAAMVQFFSDVGESKKSDVEKMEFTSYSYKIGDKTYEVDLQTKTVEIVDYDEEANVDFEEANILSFEATDKGIEYDSYIVDVKIKNNGKNEIEESSYNMAYYDKGGNFIGDDARTHDNTLSPGKAAKIESFYDEEDYLKSVATHEITSYDYYLVKDDKHGYNHYQVDLLNKTAYGSHEE